MFLAGAVCFSALALAATKSFDITFPGPVEAGSVQLTPGEYKLRVEGSNAVFEDTRTKKSFTVPVKVESVDKKYESTMLDTNKSGNNVDHLKSIELGGSKTKLQFSE